MRHDAHAGAGEIEWHPNQGRIDAARPRRLRRRGPSRRRKHRLRPLERRKEARDSREPRERNNAAERNAGAAFAAAVSFCFSASAIGYYGDRGDETVDRKERCPEKIFSLDVCVEWEEATRAGGQRRESELFTTRFGIILDREGGALAKMLTPFRMGIGGRVGDGQAVDELDRARRRDQRD